MCLEEGKHTHQPDRTHHGGRRSCKEGGGGGDGGDGGEE